LHFGNTHLGPGNLALTTVASFLASPKEGSMPLINSIDDTRREEADTHSMRQHSGENRVDKEEGAADGRERPRQPARRMSLLEMIGLKSVRQSLWVDKGRPM
jgi:hypothetical protein